MNQQLHDVVTIGIVAAAFGWTVVCGCSKGYTQPAASVPTRKAPAAVTKTTRVLGVEAFMRLKAFPETATVEGVVSAIAKKSPQVALIDRAEFEACGTTTCATLTLPVEWSGKAPRIGQIVRVTGRVIKRAGSKIFAADALTVVKPPASKP